MTITDSRAASYPALSTLTPLRGSDSHPANGESAPSRSAPGGYQLADGPRDHDTHGESAVGNQLTDSHDAPDAHGAGAVGANSRSAEHEPTSRWISPSGAQPTDRQTRDDAPILIAVGADGGHGRAAEALSVPKRPALLDPALALAADVLDDIERVRTANANRLRILTLSTEDTDGEMRGFGLDESHPDVARLAQMVELLGKIEHDAELNLRRRLRKHPLHGWVKAQRGIGDKQAARLLAAIGDPYINANTGLPRTVSALWAYCGLHVVPAGGREADGAQDDDAVGRAPKRARGEKANWSTKAKTKAYLVAKSCMKQLVKPCAREGDGPAVHVEGCVCSQYRVIYDGRRAHTSSSRPEWTDMHRLNDALRVTSKAILKDLWRAARDIHESAEGEVGR